MDEYEREIYQFLTHKENFDQMLKVLEHADMVANTLIREFWDLVYEKLTAWNVEQGGRWRLIKENYFERWSKMGITKQAWLMADESPLFRIAWESLSQDIHYGLQFLPNEQEHDVRKMQAEIEKIRSSQGTKGNQYGWALVTYYRRYNFGTDHMKDLVHILPEKRETTAMEFANLLTTMAEMLESDLDRIAGM